MCNMLKIRSRGKESLTRTTNLRLGMSPHEKVCSNRPQFLKDKRQEPSSTIASAPRNTYEYNGQNLHYFKARTEMSEGSLVQGRIYIPTCPKCCKNHPGNCCDGHEVCFMYCQKVHCIIECPKNKQGRGNATTDFNLHQFLHHTGLLLEKPLHDKSKTIHYMLSRV